MQTFTSRSEEETTNLGIEFSRRLKRGDIVALCGDLGSGKTRFAQGICKGLGIHEHTGSPTFTIINEYVVGETRIFHFDFYRVKTLREIQDIGFEEYVNDDGICLIEWAEKAQELLPSERYDVHLKPGEGEHSREITIEQVVEVAT